MDYAQYGKGQGTTPDPDQKTVVQGNQQQGGNNQRGYSQGKTRPVELINYKSGMAAAKLIQFEDFKPQISLEVKTFNPKEQKATFKNITTGSLDAVVNLHKCLGLLIDELIKTGYQLTKGPKE